MTMTEDDTTFPTLQKGNKGKSKKGSHPSLTSLTYYVNQQVFVAPPEADR